MTPLTVGAMFAGYGGLELGISEVLDVSTSWVAEYDKGPARVLAQRFPDVPNLGDVTAVDWAAVEPVDIITGGSPCQDLSHAGKRAGMRPGTRSGLWASMCDAVDIIRPQLVLWENVRGALSARADSAVEPCPVCMGDGGGITLRALGRVLGDLAEIGYDAAWCGLRAADVGAPHGRYRVFVLAWPTNADPDGGRREQRHPQIGRLSIPRPRDLAASEPESLTLLPTPAVNDMGAAYDPHTWDTWTARMRATHGNGNGHGKSLNIEALRMLPTPRSTNNENRQSAGYGGGKDGNFHELVTGRSSWGQYAPAIARWGAVLGRPAPEPTEATGRDGAHRLSPRFVEWLMGLPDHWVTGAGLTRAQQLKALGNGVVPQQAAAALRHLLTVRATLTPPEASCP